MFVNANLIIFELTLIISDNNLSREIKIKIDNITQLGFVKHGY